MEDFTLHLLRGWNYVAGAAAVLLDGRLCCNYQIQKLRGFLFILYFFFLMIRRPPRSPPFPYTTLFRSATFPSDTLSTPQVQLPGVARLARWGVLDAVLAAGTPVTRDVQFDQGDALIAGRYPGYQGVEAMCSPRRTLLDRVLVDAARAAGAEVRANFAVDEILGDGPVTGI